jgi:hypothetical protein
MSALRNMRSVSSAFRRTGAALPRAAEVLSAAALPFPAHAVRTRRVTGKTAGRCVVPALFPRRASFLLGRSPRSSRPGPNRLGRRSRLSCRVLPVRSLGGRGRIDDSTQRQRERDSKGRCKFCCAASHGISLPFSASPERNAPYHTHIRTMPIVAHSKLCRRGYEPCITDQSCSITSPRKFNAGSSRRAR